MLRQLITLLFCITILQNPVAVAQLQSGSQKPTILVLGDSLSSAYGFDPESGWVSLLRHRLKDNSFDYRVINASISGDTSANGLSRLPALLEQYRPMIIIVELGGNDGLRGLPISNLRQHLAKIIELSQQNNARVLLVGIKIPPNYGSRYTRAFYDSYTTLAEKYKLTLVPFLLENVGDQDHLMQKDRIHPQKKAQAIILNNVWPYLLKLLH